VGNGVTVEYPNGRIDFIPFDGQEVVTIGPLARGLYKMQVTGVRGLVPLTPVALSQDQEVELKVLTNLDIGLGIALGALIGFGLLFYGRPRLLLLPAAGMQLVRRLKNWQTITRYY